MPLWHLGEWDATEVHLSPMLFNIYLKPLGEVIWGFGVRCHQYAADTQLVREQMLPYPEETRTVALVPIEYSVSLGSRAL